MRLFRLMIKASLVACVLNNPTYASSDVLKPLITQLHGKLALIGFWRADCAACQAELPILNSIAHDNPQLTIAIVKLTINNEPQAELNHLQKLTNLPNVIVFNTPSSEQLLKNWGNDSAVLPFSVMLKPNGEHCANHTGLLGKNLIKQWTKTCSA